MKKVLAGFVLAIAATTPALADFYILQDSGTKRCRIVEQRPAPGLGVVIGDMFAVRVEAERHMQTVEVCRDGTSGRGPGVIIDEPRR